MVKYFCDCGLVMDYATLTSDPPPAMPCRCGRLMRMVGRAFVIPCDRLDCEYQGDNGSGHKKCSGMVAFRRSDGTIPGTTMLSCPDYKKKVG